MRPTGKAFLVVPCVLACVRASVHACVRAVWLPGGNSPQTWAAVFFPCPFRPRSFSLVVL